LLSEEIKKRTALLRNAQKEMEDAQKKKAGMEEKYKQHV